MQFGYFSEKQKIVGGSVIFSTPNGKWVECTQVGEYPPTFDDTIHLGEVKDYIRQEVPSPFEDDFEHLNAETIKAFESEDSNRIEQLLKIKIAVINEIMGEANVNKG